MKTPIGKPVKREIESTEKEEVRPKATIEERIRTNTIMGYIGGALCLAFLLTIAYPMYENSKTISVDGTVVSVLSESNGNGSRNNPRQTEYWHEFRFTDRQGVEHVARSAGWVGRDTSHSVGSVVSIGYYADDFTKVRDFSWFGLWGIQLFFLIPGAALIAFSIVVVKKLREEEQAENLSGCP